MPKIWDILPPPPRPAPKTKKTVSRKRSLSLWYLVILVVFSFVFVFGGSWAKLKYFDNSPSSPAPSASQSSSTAKTQGNLSIKILNSTGRFEEATKVKDILTKNGFNVVATETAVNTYDQTIVYYTPNSPSVEKYALEIADLLKSYNAKTQKFSQSSSYDIAIIIGGKLY